MDVGPPTKECDQVPCPIWVLLQALLEGRPRNYADALALLRTHPRFSSLTKVDRARALAEADAAFGHTHRAIRRLRAVLKVSPNDLLALASYAELVCGCGNAMEATKNASELLRRIKPVPEHALLALTAHLVLLVGECTPSMDVRALSSRISAARSLQPTVGETLYSECVIRAKRSYGLPTKVCDALLTEEHGA